MAEECCADPDLMAGDGGVTVTRNLISRIGYYFLLLRSHLIHQTLSPKVILKV